MSLIPEVLDKENQNWEPLPGWEDSYFISDHGRVWATPRKVPCDHTDRWGNHVTEQRRPGCLLNERKNGHGYVQYSLKLSNGDEAREENPLAHRLVMQVFGSAPPTDDHDVVNHIDGDKSNNHISNLEWVTGRENSLHGALLHYANEVGEEKARRKITAWLKKIND